MICASCGKESPETVDRCPECTETAALEGRYLLNKIVGHGAAGTTYQATRIEDGATVAIKELPYRRVENVKSLELFEREANVLRELDHRGVPKHFDDFSREIGNQSALYIVEEYVEGRTLAEEMKNQPYSELQVIDILDELLSILQYLHRRAPPVIHRDIKPSNVMRVEKGPNEGRLVLIDFGAVRASIKEPVVGGSTIAGTFGYMSPEQFLGKATPASDLYALGVLAVVLLTRRSPEELSDHEHRLNWRPAVSNAHPILVRFLASLLETNPEKRASVAIDARKELGKVRYRIVTGIVSGPRTAVTLGVVGCMLVAGAVAVFSMRPEEVPEEGADGTPAQLVMHPPSPSKLAVAPKSKSSPHGDFVATVKPEEIIESMGSVIPGLQRCPSVWKGHDRFTVRGMSRSNTLTKQKSGEWGRRVDHLRLISRTGVRMDDERRRNCRKMSMKRLPPVEPGKSVLFDIVFRVDGDQVHYDKKDIRVYLLRSKWRILEMTAGINQEMLEFMLQSSLRQTHQMCVELNFDLINDHFHRHQWSHRIRVSVDGQGNVRDVEHLGRKLGSGNLDGNLQNCMGHRVRSMTFPPPSGGSAVVTLEYNVFVE